MLLRVMSGYCSKVQVRWVLRAGRAALVLLTRAAANAGRLSGWMRASASALPAASRLHPPLTPSVFLRLLPPIESLAGETYGMLRSRATLHSLEITFSRTPNA